MIYLKKIFWRLLFLPLLWFLGLVLFVYSIPKKPADISTRTDAIVVWTGAACRITTGLELLDQGLGDKLFVSGVKGGNPKLLSSKCATVMTPEKLEEIRQRIHMGHNALSTKGNAVETAEWVARNNVKSLRLVTTAVHMPRSLMEFREKMPAVEVIPHPVSIKIFDHRDWIHRVEVFRKVALEYSKYLVVLCGVRPDWRDNLVDEKENNKES